jgi:hypothetical protein
VIVEPERRGAALFLHFKNGAVEQWKVATSPARPGIELFRYDGQYWTKVKEVLKGRHEG